MVLLFQMSHQNPIPNIRHRHPPQRHSMASNVTRRLRFNVDLARNDTRRVCQSLLESDCRGTLVMWCDVCAKPSFWLVV
jgi:hypothetical protein